MRQGFAQVVLQLLAHLVEDRVRVLLRQVADIDVDEASVGHLVERVAAPDPAEVAAVFEVPLTFVLDPGNMRTRLHDRLGSQFKVDEISFGGYRIWGATAAILRSFRELLHGEPGR